jgi:hypothetical protein
VIDDIAKALGEQLRKEQERSVFARLFTTSGLTSEAEVFVNPARASDLMEAIRGTRAKDPAHPFADAADLVMGIPVRVSEHVPPDQLFVLEQPLRLHVGWRGLDVLRPKHSMIAFDTLPDDPGVTTTVVGPFTTPAGHRWAVRRFQRGRHVRRYVADLCETVRS